MSFPPEQGARCAAWSWVSPSPSATQALGEAFGRRARPGHVVALVGPLGSGKTCFIQGLARGLGVREPVTSPTFVLMQRYEGRVPLVHVDAYRLEDPEELWGLGLEELAEGAVLACEWADRLEELLPEEALWIRLERMPRPETREVHLEARGVQHARWLEEVRREWAGGDGAGS